MAQAQPDAPPEALADEAIPLLMAGQEPPAAALTWLLDRLARSPSAGDDPRAASQHAGGRAESLTVS